MTVPDLTRLKPEGGYAHKFQLFSRNVWLYLVFLFCYSTSFGIFLVALGLYLLRLGYDESLVGSIELVAMLSGAVLCLPAGRLVDSLGAKNTLLAAAGLVALGRIGLVASTDSGVILMVAMLFGSGMAIHWIGSDVLLSASSSAAERPLVFSSRFATFSFAMVLGSLLGGILPMVFGVLLHVEGSDAQVYNLTLSIAAVISAIGILPVLRVSNPSDVKFGSSRAVFLDFRVKEPGLVAKLVLPQAAISMSMGAIFPFLSIFFKYHLLATTEQVGGVIAGGAIASAVLALLAPKLVDRLGKVGAVACLQVVGFPFLLLTGYVPSLGIAAATFWCGRAFAASSYPVMATFVMETVDADQRGRVSAMMNLCWSGGWAVSAWVSGLIMTAGHYSETYLLSSVLLALGCAAWYGLLRKRETAGGNVLV